MHLPAALAIAATAVLVLAVAAIAATLSLDQIDRRRRRRGRELARLLGVGPYALTHNVPRGADLALEIADHLRSRYRVTIAVARSLTRLGTKLSQLRLLSSTEETRCSG